MSDLVGRRIGNYRLEALLGEGGMGAVYRARDVHLNRVVALKVMNQRLARDPEFQRRFLQEAQAAAHLKHPSIVHIYHFDNSQGLLYMAMTYVPGLTLGATMRRLAANKQVILLSESLALIAQVGDALGYAHRQGVFHRDIKPDNVLLEPLDVPDREGGPLLRAVVTDFGLAKLREGGIETQTGLFLGTMPYMSPEQCRGRNIDGRSDIYSLGILLYQLVSGRLPFEVKTPADAAEKHIREMPPLPRTFRPDLPPEIEAIILKTLAKRPEDRQQTGEELARDLRRAAAGLGGEVATQLAPAISVASLVTEVMSKPDQIPAPVIGPDLSLFAESDTLIIQREGQAVQKQPLTKERVVIGRSPGNDIVLEAAGVSRQHVRLERTKTRWQLVDLGSSNGTWIKGSKLLPNIPEPWEPNQAVRIGPFTLHWQPATTTSLGTYPQPSGPSGIMPPAPPAATQILTMDGQLGIVVNPTHIEVDAGKTVQVQLDLFNQGLTVDHFRPEVEGIPAEWVTLAQEPVQLMPDGKTSLPFTIHPPRHSHARAGNHRYHLRLYSQARQQAVGTIEGSVTIRPFSQFAIDAQPTQLQQGGICRITIRHEGNALNSYRLTGRDSAEALRFDGQQAALTVEAGKTAVVPLKIQAKNRPFIGRPQSFPFQVEVAASEREAQTRSGTLEVKPRVPMWFVSLLSLLLVTVCGLGIFVISSVIGQQNIQATETAVAQLALISLTQTRRVEEVQMTAMAEQGAKETVTSITLMADVTSTSTPTPSPIPTFTGTPLPTSTEIPTSTPTNTPTPIPTNTLTPLPTPLINGYPNTWTNDNSSHTLVSFAISRLVIEKVDDNAATLHVCRCSDSSCAVETELDPSQVLASFEGATLVGQSSFALNAERVWVISARKSDNNLLVTVEERTRSSNTLLGTEVFEMEPPPFGGAQAIFLPCEQPVFAP